jgi:rRNA processing protein Gar1
MQLPPIYTTSVPTTNSMPKSTAPGPAIIENNDDVTPPPRQAQTCTQHQSSHVHLINSAITKALMPLIDLKPTATFPAHGYIAATQALLENTYGVIHKTNSPVYADSINFIGAIINSVTGNVLEYYNLIESKSHRTIWQHSFANKLGRLFQEIRNIKGTDTCFFICKQQMPQHKQATYRRICCNYCPQKDEPYCTQLTVSGDQITYDGNKSTPTATLVTAKLLINSTISTPKEKFYGMDLSNFYVMTPMKEYEYM